MAEKQESVSGPKSGVKVELAKSMRGKKTPAEVLLWEYLWGNRCGGHYSRMQQVIDGFIADFYYHAAELIVDVDGGVHVGQAENDEERDRIISARGIRVVRFTNDRVFAELEAVLMEIQVA